MARRRTMTEEDEIQLVDQGNNEEEEEEEAEGGGLTLGVRDGDDRDSPSCLKINFSDLEEDSPRVEDERHIKHPGKLKMRLRKLRSPRSKRWCWWITLAVLAILTIVFLAVPLGLWSDRKKETCFDYESDDESSEPYPFLFLKNEGKFLLCNKGETQLEGTLGKHHSHIKEERVNVYEYSQETVLNITRLSDNCLRIEWVGISSDDAPLMDCFDMKDGKWFGGHELYSQYWPFDNMSINMTPFLPHDYLANSTYQSRDVFGPVLHPLWLTSNGAGILVDRRTPLWVSINDTNNRDQVCLQALPYALECVPHSFEQAYLFYTICIHKEIVDTAKYFLNELPHPSGVPAKVTFQDPIWSTWGGAFKTKIDNNTVRDYVQDIGRNKFNISQLELEDGYGDDGAYGDLSMKLDTGSLSSVNLTAWVHPFVNPMADAFLERLDKDFFLPGRSKVEGDSVSLVKWWHRYGAVINYVDEGAANYQREALIAFMKKYNLVSLKFYAGEITYLPKCVYTKGVENPGDFATAYTRFVANFSEEVVSRAEVRVGYFSQEQPMWVRILGRTSTWDIHNGLKSVLTAALTFGIAGYPFVLPDMIGGNGVDPGNLNQPATPDKMLFVRWMQLHAFLPVMQFSVPPFHEDYADDETIDVTAHALELVQLHRTLADTMYNLSLEAMNSSFPIIRPLWWLDSDYINVDDQFLIGDDIMIAPILDESDTRCVDFPADIIWTRYGHDSTEYPRDCRSIGDCNCWFEVTLTEYLYFIRIRS